MKLGIIVPCYNEENRIDVDTFVKFINLKKDCYLCFVNDGSKDNTIKVLRAIKSKAPEFVSVIDMKKNKGKLAAIKAGARFLYNEQNVELLAYMNANAFSIINNVDKLLAYEQSENFAELYKTIGKSNNIKKGVFKRLFSNLPQFLINLFYKKSNEKSEYDFIQI